MAKIEIAPLGEFLREQRRNAQLSLRQLAEQAGVSNPYLSQIERGLRKPSAEILQQIAKGLRISSEQLYVQAGILDERPTGELAVESALLSDVAISERQKRVLLEIYRSFRAEHAAGSSASAAPAAGPSTKRSSTGPTTPRRTTTQRAARPAAAKAPSTAKSPAAKRPSTGKK